MALPEHPPQVAFDVLFEELRALPNSARIIEGLGFAARLIEESAYAYAEEISGDQIVALILLAAKVEGEAKRIGQTTFRQTERRVSH